MYLFRLIIILIFLTTTVYADEKNLTNKEINYLKTVKTIKLCVDPDWLPYEAIRDGKHIGIGADVLNLISKKSGLTMELVTSKTWSETLELFQARKCDILSMLNITEERTKYMKYTKPYLTGHTVFISQTNHPFIANPSEIYGKKIVLVSGYSITEFLKKEYKDIEIIEVDSYDKAFQMVSNGDADLTADYLISAGDRIQRMGLDDLKVVGNTPYKNEFRIGIQKDMDTLLQILDKTISNIEIHELNRIISKWKAVKYDHDIDYTILWEIVIGALLIIIGTIIWNRKLIKEKKKTQEALNKLEKLQIELEKLAITDKLTSLYNRNKLDMVLKNELHRTHRFKHPFSVILLDIDHFKDVNDTYGHQVGDQVLIEISKILQAYTRDTDIVGRWGGEEFLIILPESTINGTSKLAQNLRLKIEKHLFSQVKHTTASFGATQYQEGDCMEDLLCRADQALYKAKELGRNRVVTL